MRFVNLLQSDLAQQQGEVSVTSRSGFPMRRISGRVAAVAAGLAIFSLSAVPAFANESNVATQSNEYNQVFTFYAGDPDAAVEGARRSMQTEADTGEFAGGGCNEVAALTADASDTDAVTTWRGEIYAFCWGGK